MAASRRRSPDHSWRVAQGLASAASRIRTDVAKAMNSRRVNKLHPFSDRRSIEKQPGRRLDHWDGRSPLPEHFESFYRTIKRFRLLTAEEECELALRWHKDRDEVARERLILCHLPLVAKFARRASRSQRLTLREQFAGFENKVAYRDYLLAGIEGLLHALDRFDPKQGKRLSAFAKYWVAGAIHRH
jgi:DNA-directed RNA polymerase sigma subunit (sigma70/sigma32)